MLRPRLKDIAERVGCSIAVVSHVVNHSSGNISCRDELRDIILQTAAELDYVPHYTNRTLKSSPARTIGLYIPPLEGASIGFMYESSIMVGIERVCREKAYDLLVISTGNNSDDAERVAKLNTRRVDGLILLHVKSGSNWMFSLAEKRRNLIAINYYGEAQVDTINFNDKAATAMAVSELLRAGHRRIAYVGPMHANAGQGAHLRLEGFISTCISLGITVDPSWIFDERFPGTLPLERAVMSEFQVAKRIAESIAIMPLEQRPTAIVGYSDHCTLYLVRELQRLKLRFPTDISAVGIDNSSICTLVQPQLASVQQPLVTMGEEATKHLIEQAEQSTTGEYPTSETKPRWYKLSEPTFIQRESIRSLNV